MRVLTFTILLLVVLTGKAFSQSADSLAMAQSLAEYPISLYKAATAQSQNLYNGRQYFVYDAREEGHQFFDRKKWLKGVVAYDGQRFDSIPMLYDIVKDELVIKHFNGDHVLLQSEKVDYFLYDSHQFARLESGKEVAEQMRTGFYDVIYAGKSQALVRRTKQRQEKIVDKRVTAYFPARNFYFLRKDGMYHSVNSKKSALGLFPEHKKELRKTLRDRNIHFRTNKETAIITIAATYDELANL